MDTFISFTTLMTLLVVLAQNMDASSARREDDVNWKPPSKFRHPAGLHTSAAYTNNKERENTSAPYTNNKEEENTSTPYTTNEEQENKTFMDTDQTTQTIPSQSVRADASKAGTTVFTPSSASMRADSHTKSATEGGPAEAGVFRDNTPGLDGTTTVRGSTRPTTSAFDGDTSTPRIDNTVFASLSPPASPSTSTSTAADSSETTSPEFTTDGNSPGTTGATIPMTTVSPDNGTSDKTNNADAGGSTISQSCPEMCICPDYESWANTLVPVLRQTFQGRLDKFTDQIVKVYLLKELIMNGENPQSVLLNYVSQYANDGVNGNVAISLHDVLYGVTRCSIPPNTTFVLDADVEAMLFPQVKYKEAFFKADALLKGDTADSATPETEKLRSIQLYNISLVCHEGSRVVIAKNSSLYKYGRWTGTRCEVSTEDVLVMDRNLSLIELSVLGGTAAWLQNLTVSGSSLNLTSTEGVAGNSSGLNNSLTGALNTKTIFADIQEVSVWNTALSVQDLSDTLAWFNRASSLKLRNNSLGDFNCSQLIPSSAGWTELKLSYNGLKTVPGCLLRHSVITLRLTNNVISDLTSIQYPRFVPATSLEVLDLSDNNISDVGILADMNIVALYLTGNKISTLNKMSFIRLPELSLLDLSRNQLHWLDPGCFKSLWLLQELHLQHNNLERFDSSSRPMRRPLPSNPSLNKCKIFLNNNRLSHPPFRSDGYQPGDYMLVYAADNPYACDCDMELYAQRPVNVSLLGRYEDSDQMKCRYPSALRGRPLDHIAFADTCPVVEDCPEGCTCTLSRHSESGADVSLKTVSNDSDTTRNNNNSDTNHDNSFVSVDCTKVENLHQPASLPATYPLRIEFQNTGNATETPLTLHSSTYLLRIVSFNISGRGLSRVPEFFCEALPEAVLLDLSFNKLTRLPQCFHTRSDEFPTLELRLAGNPWSCDCDAVPMRSWLAKVIQEGPHSGVNVSDVRDVWCSADTRPGLRVSEWDISDCEEPNYLPWVVTLGVVLGLAVVLGPLLYIYRMKAILVIHAQLHVRPFTKVHHFKEEEYEYEALVILGSSDEQGLRWVVDELTPRTEDSHHRICIPDRDFPPGGCMADSYASAVAHSKAILCVLNTLGAAPAAVAANNVNNRDEWWWYAFQLARAQNARAPYVKLLLVVLGSEDTLKEAQLPEDVRTFLETNTYLRIEDRWLWKKLFFYLPDPPKTAA